MRQQRSCAYPGCPVLVRYDHIACTTHWNLLPEKLQADYYGSCPTCSRSTHKRAVSLRIARYFELRATLAELMNKVPA